MNYDGFDVNNIQNNRTILSFGITEFVHKIKSKNRCMCCLGENDEWESYILPCGHSVHTRCFRKYIGGKDECICPVCKTFEIKKDKCILCDVVLEDKKYICNRKCLEDNEEKLKN